MPLENHRLPSSRWLRCGIDRTRAMCGSVLTRRTTACFNEDSDRFTEIHMYIGSGILVTILIFALVIYLLRRA